MPLVITQLPYGGVPPEAVSCKEYGSETIAVGGVVVVMTTGARLGTAIVSACGVDVAPVLSFTVTVNANGLPVEVVGVPLMTPVLGLSAKPGGRDPVATAQLLYGGVPLPAANCAV